MNDISQLVCQFIATYFYVSLIARLVQFIGHAMQMSLSDFTHLTENFQYKFRPLFCGLFFLIGEYNFGTNYEKLTTYRNSGHNQIITGK